ncbi:MAG: NADP oxidoreductase [Flavobacteriaceae bacterium]|nr:NADP oxidoreductase [Flavobacteriaceae bacterium]
MIMVTKNKLDRSNLMHVLWDVQRKKRHIGHDDITKIAQEFELSRMEVEGVVTFYHFYHRTDCGKYTIYINDCVISQFSGRDAIVSAFEKAIGVKIEHVTDDKMFGLFKSPCIGLSDQEPACLINFQPFTKLTPDKVKKIISQIRNGKKPSEICDTPKSIIQYKPNIDKTIFFKPYKPYSSLTFLKKYSPGKIIEEIKKSNLAGCGGAFFPTGLKWQFCKQNKADQKYIICNADEGEPGTFKDRVLLEEHPELLIEGMIFAAYAVGATQGAIYLRAEYRYLKPKLEKLLSKYREDGKLGKGIAAKIPFGFDIYIHLGAGAYVCGEETALIHSIEGKRGEPGTKEFFPVEKGFKGKPTIVNNVETLCAVPRILEMGVDQWLEIGTKKTPGTKLLSVSGDCEKKGIYEIEWGMNMREFIKLTGAKNTKMIQFSGPSGELLSEQDFDRNISGEDLICGGSVMIYNDKRDLLHILKNYSNFFVEESCGICVPCRTGNFLLNKKIGKLILGHAEEKDLEDIKEWSKIIKTTSRCGLGQMSSNSLNDAMKKFPNIFKQKLSENTDYNKAFHLEKAVEEYDSIINDLTSDYE